MFDRYHILCITYLSYPCSRSMLNQFGRLLKARKKEKEKKERKEKKQRDSGDNLISTDHWFATFTTRGPINRLFSRAFRADRFATYYTGCPIICDPVIYEIIERTAIPSPKKELVDEKEIFDCRQNETVRLVRVFQHRYKSLLMLLLLIRVDECRWTRKITREKVHLERSSCY